MHLIRMNPDTYIPPDVHSQLTESERHAIHDTAPVLSIRAAEIMRSYHKDIMTENPDLHNIFSYSAHKSGSQEDVVGGVVCAYATHIHDLSAISHIIPLIVNKHASLSVVPEHYAVVGAYLMKAFKNVLGDGLTEEQSNAWYQGYWQFARVLIDAEAQLYRSAQWSGFRDFKVIKKVKESNEITSFYLSPMDPSLLPLKPYIPGQFLTVRLWVKELNRFQNRHYSLSDTPSADYYRISVKHKARPCELASSLSSSDISNTGYPSLISSILHNHVEEGSTVQCAFPFGAFHLEADDSPVVLISAGVGITPMLAMLNTLAEATGENGGRQVTWIHGAHNKVHHAFGQHVKDTVNKSNGRIKSVVFYSDPHVGNEGSIQGQDFDIQGRVDLKLVNPEILYLGEAQFYICGPDKFMSDNREKLVSLGVKPEKIFIESFSYTGVKA